MSSVNLRACVGLLALCLLLALAGCRRQSEVGAGPNKQQGNPRVADARMESTPLAAFSSGPAQEFTRLTNTETGIDFANNVSFDDLNIERLTSFSGLSCADYDNDGDLDAYFCGIQVPNRLYRNEGHWKFRDVTAESGTDLSMDGLSCCGATFYDIEGDGDLDLYVSVRNGSNRLFVNDGMGQFADEAAARGVASSASTICAAPFDADRDGDLDLYLANSRDATGNVVVQEFLAKKDQPVKEILGTLGVQKSVSVGVDGNITFQADADQLYINDGSGIFTEEAEARGISASGDTLNVLACDFNDDGYTDLQLSTDFAKQDQYLINNGDGTFSDKAKDMLRKVPYYSRGSDAGDLNNDGLMDLFVVDTASRDYETDKLLGGDSSARRYEQVIERPQQQQRNHLYINRGDGWMSELAEFAAVTSADWGWAARIADLDSDGTKELLATNGFVSRSSEYDYVRQTFKNLNAGFTQSQMIEYKKGIPDYRTQDVVWIQDKPLSFVQAPGNMGLDAVSIGCGCSLSDLDGDGDMDILINTVNDSAEVYRNDAAQGRRVVLALRQQDSSNAQAVGARVWAHCGDDVLMQDVILNRGFATGESADIYLGLGAHEQIDSLEVRWPDGKLQVFDNLAANMRHTVWKSEGLPQWQRPVANPLFAETRLGWEQMEADTIEPEFGDDGIPGSAVPLVNIPQPLLPVQRSLQGTGVGVADYDEDGYLDLYFAGPLGQRGRLYQGSKQEFAFEVGTALAATGKKDSEEMAALWLDANADGRLDLLVSNGSMEHPAGDPLYKDYIALNLPNGFTEVELPDGGVSSAALCSADIDRDGSLEVFIAGQLVPHAFAKAERSTIVTLGPEGMPAEATAQFAPQLGRPGPINDAQFADLNNDGWQDLLLACEWSGVKLCLNNGGVLAAPRDISPTGMWQGLGLGDFDNDGDLDVLAGNWGSNTKYRASDSAPMTLFCDDFDGNGTRDLVEVQYGAGKLLPRRGRSDSGYAIGYIPVRWPTWEDFSKATFQDVYGDPAAIAERYEARELRSVLLLNDGAASFAARPLPQTAQFAPVFGIGVGDFNNDGTLDALLAQNFYGTQPETSRWVSGYGALLLGDGAGGFFELAPAQSGVWLGSDARGVITADLNTDGLLDAVVSMSNLPEPVDRNLDGMIEQMIGHGRGSPRVLFGRAEYPREGRGLAVTVHGKGTNTAAVGAGLTLELSDGRRLTRIVQAGSGYLSSYSGPLHFGVPQGADAVKLTVQWPDGSTSDTTDLAGDAVSVQW